MATKTTKTTKLADLVGRRVVAHTAASFMQYVGTLAAVHREYGTYLELRDVRNVVVVAPDGDSRHIFVGREVWDVVLVEFRSVRPIDELTQLRIGTWMTTWEDAERISE